MVSIFKLIFIQFEWFYFKHQNLDLQNFFSPLINLHKQSTFLEITPQKQVHNFQVTTVDDDHHLKSDLDPSQYTTLLPQPWNNHSQK